MQWQFSSFVVLTGRTSRREGGEKLRFPFGRELTTCWRLFIRREGLACATVNKPKCWEVQWVSGAPSKAAPTWHTAFDVLAKFVFSTAMTLSQSVVHKPTHPHEETHSVSHEQMQSHLRNWCGFAHITRSTDVNMRCSTLRNDCMGAASPSEPSINSVLSLDCSATPGLAGYATDILTECFSMMPPVHAALFPFKNGWWSIVVVTHFILQRMVANIKKLSLKKKGAKVIRNITYKATGWFSWWRYSANISPWQVPTTLGFVQTKQGG